MTPSPQEVTQLLKAWSGGDEAAFEQLMPLVYEELRRVAKRYMGRERAGHTLQTTALVHEAYLRIAGQRRAQWENRSQLFAIAAQQMRRILVDYARSHGASKRGGAAVKVSLDNAMLVSRERSAAALVVDESLTKLAVLDPEQARITELRFFGGLTVEETAEVIGISPATVKREWTMAKAWLTRDLRTSEQAARVLRQ